MMSINSPTDLFLIRSATVSATFSFSGARFTDTLSSSVSSSRYRNVRLTFASVWFRRYDRVSVSLITVRVSTSTGSSVSFTWSAVASPATPWTVPYAFSSSSVDVTNSSSAAVLSTTMTTFAATRLVVSRITTTNVKNPFTIPIYVSPCTPLTSQTG